MKPLIFIIYALILVIVKPEYGQEINNYQLSTILAITLAMIASHIFFSRDKNWARIDTLFIISYCIVNFQWPALILISNTYPENWRFDRLASQYLMIATWMAAIFFAAWLIGYWIPVKKIKSRIRVLRANKWDVVITAFLFFVFIYLAGQNYLSGMIYKEATTDVGLTGSVQGRAAYIYLLYQIFVIVVIARWVYDNRAAVDNNADIIKMIFKKENAILAGLVLTGVLYFSIAGERGQVIQILCALVLGFAGIAKPMPLRNFLAIVAIGAISMTFLRYTRAGGADFIRIGAPQMGMWEYTDSLAKSLYATFVGMKVVEANAGEFYGMLWVSNLMGVVPFAQSAFLNITGLAIQDISGPAAITTYAYGASPTSGLGTTLVADLYMNFGVTLSMPILALYGQICRRFQISLSGVYGPFWFIAAVIFASLMIYIPRAAFLTQLQPVVWGGGLAFILYRVRFVRPTESFS